MKTIKIEVPEESKIKPEEVNSTRVSEIYNFCPLCENLGVILDEGCCVDCWEEKILPYK